MNKFKKDLIVTKYKEREVKIDLGSFIQENERLTASKKEYKSLSTILKVISIILIVLPLLISLLNSNFSLVNFIIPSNILNSLPYLAIYTFMFSLYMVRDLDLFDHKPNNFSLQNLDSHKGEIYLNDYLKHEVKEFIENAYFSPNSFVVDIYKSILQDDEVLNLLVTRLGVNVDELSKELDKLSLESKFTFKESWQNFFIYLFDDGIKLEQNKIDKFTLFFTLNKYFLKNVFLNLGVQETDLEGIRLWFKTRNQLQIYFEKFKILSKLKPVGDINRAYTAKITPVLDQNSTNFTRNAAKGEFEVMIGRNELAQKVFESLEKQTGGTVMVLGEPGVGKTLFLKYMATRMVVEDIPDTLKDYRLMVLDLNYVLTVNNSVDNFKNTLLQVFKEIKKSGNIVLALEDFSQILNIRENERNEVINLLITELGNTNFPVIATSTKADFSKYVKINPRLASIFNVIELKEPDDTVSLQILEDEASNLEHKYKINVNVKVLKRIVEFSSKFDFDRVMPDKGINLLEEGIIFARSKGLTFLDESTIDQLLSNKVGVNVGRITTEEGNTLKNIEEDLHKRVVGQANAVSAVAAAIRRSRSGLVSGKRPIASFLFFGPTGVGKTELAKALASVYYGDERLMFRLDMSEYQEAENLTRLIGFVNEKGSFEGGYLTEAVRSKPFSLVLLDEIEKANPKVLDLFLQILDEGKVTDGAGRKIDFTNTILIMTSNVASNQISDSFLAGKPYNEVFIFAEEQLRKSFRVEFLNRFDRLIMFKPLNKAEIGSIVEIILNKIKIQLKDKGINFFWDEETIKELSELGYSPVYGARELRRVVQESIEDKLANLIVGGYLKSGKDVVFNGLTVKNIEN